MAMDATDGPRTARRRCRGSSSRRGGWAWSWTRRRRPSGSPRSRSSRPAATSSWTWTAASSATACRCSTSRPGTSRGSGRSARSSASRTVRRRSAPRSRSPAPPPRARSSPSPATATTSSGSTSPPPRASEACAILAREMRDKALSTRVGPTYRLWEVKFGSYPFDGERAGKAGPQGARRSPGPPTRSPPGPIVVTRDGEPVTLTWDEVAVDPGWCKLDWIVADPERRALANASNMLDVTWEAPDGAITPLDGFVDPYFQEVYLEPESLPLFQKLIGELSTDSVEVYVGAAGARGRQVRDEGPRTGARSRAGSTTSSGSPAGTPRPSTCASCSTSRRRSCTRSRRWSGPWTRRTARAPASRPS